MTHELRPVSCRLPPGDVHPDLPAAREALARAYHEARLGGYRTGSPQMHALIQAETRYQQAKSHQQPGTWEPTRPRLTDVAGERP